MWSADDVVPRCRPLIVLALCGITFLTGAAWSTACLRAPRFHVAARGGAIRVGSVRPKGSAPDGTNNDASFVAIFAAVKDEHDYVDEWLQHHIGIGVGTVYIYDHGSSPPLQAVLADHIAAGRVEYAWWDPGNFTSRVTRTVPQHYPQMDMYDDCLRRHGTKHHYIAFIDVDEVYFSFQFLVLMPAAPNGGTLPGLLRHFRRFDAFGGLVAHWRVFGTSGHMQRPKSGVLQAYTKCVPLNGDVNGRLVKSIVDTRFATHSLSAHHFAYNSSMFAVNEHFQRVAGEGSDPQTARWLAVNHYITRSKQEYEEKLRRGSAAGITRGPGFDAYIDRKATETCLDAATPGLAA